MSGKNKEVSSLRWSFTSQKKRGRIMAAACERLRWWPETAALLDLAADLGISIRFSDSLLGTDTDGMFVRNRTTNACAIELKPCLKPEDLAVPLIHELRHLWQAEALGLKPDMTRLAEKDVSTALLFTRLREADAYAFTNLMIARINNVAADVGAQDEYAKSLRGGAQELTPAQQEAADQFLADRLQARLPAEKAKMEADFIKALGWLDSYDRETLSEYHRRYTHPYNEPQGHAKPEEGKPLAAGALRGMLKTGTLPFMPAYFDALDDAALEKTVMQGLAPDVREAAGLIAAFEKAAGALSRDMRQQKKLEIDGRVQKAVRRGP